jgi:NitT/TauT family transport system permease protein
LSERKVRSRSWGAAIHRHLTGRPELYLSVLLFVAIVGAWQWLIVWFNVSPLLMPTPLSILSSLLEGFRSGLLIQHFAVTFYETIAGFLLGAVTGLLLGALIGMFPLLEKTLYPYIVAFQTIPKVAIAPLFVVWFGFGVTSKIIITATIAFFPVLASAIGGLRAAPADQIELFVTYTANRWQIFWKVRVPHALPYIMVGLDVGIVLAVIGAIVGEFVGAREGLGFLILQRNFSMDMAAVFAILVLLAIMGIGLHLMIRTLHRRVVFWMEDNRDWTIGA